MELYIKNHSHERFLIPKSMLRQRGWMLKKLRPGRCINKQSRKAKQINATNGQPEGIAVKSFTERQGQYANRKEG
jgi:hypothetical protein